MARYGGEEFAAVLASTDPLQARSVFERLRCVVQEYDWSRIAAGLRVTISVGVVKVELSESFDAAAARADRLLYLAKAGGRNRVVETLDEP